MYCPDCPLLLEFLAFGKTYLANPSVKLTCSENMFEKDIDVIAQPGIHSLEVSTAVHYSLFLSIEVLHGGHVACQEQYNIIPMGQNVHSNAKHFYCSWHATCKTSNSIFLCVGDTIA